MGAYNSIPQTVRIDNPQRGLGIQVTPSVVSRLIGDKEDKPQRNFKYVTNEDKNERQPTQNSYNSVPKMPNENMMPTEDERLYERKCKEIEEYEFDRSVEKLETMIGKPLMWIEEDTNATIKLLRENLIKCYRDNPKETLSCSEEAKKYQKYIFKEQYETVLRKNEYDDE